MLDDARNLIGDIASGKIKDERLLLLAEELRVSERKLSDTTAEKEVLRAENLELRARIDQLESTVNYFRLQIEQDLSGRKLISEEAQKILDVFFDQDSELTIERIGGLLGLAPSVAKFHFDTLISEKLVRLSRMEPQPYMFGQRQELFAAYIITPSGRKQVMKVRNPGC